MEILIYVSIGVICSCIGIMIGYRWSEIDTKNKRWVEEEYTPIYPKN